jgi:proteasome lid subunit RPN8/RPN11
VSYVSIWKPIYDRILQVSQENENEVIGLLLGRLDNDILIIEDSISGEFQGEPNRVTLPPNTLARIADDILKGRAKGNIIGWYHSHTQSGVAFSETDVQTQLTLQQFSPLITAMVVDKQTKDVGYFRVDPATRTPTRIPESNVSISEQSATIHPASHTQPQNDSSTIDEQPPPSTSRIRLLSKKSVIVCIIIAVASVLAVLTLILYQVFGSPKSIMIFSNQLPPHQIAR